ncbi:MAG: LysR family transcriptional regulator [Clostridia bacterium]|nr:LysR family transcriptional regulator [Clostridia bacterium]
MLDIGLRQLESLIAVAETGSFSMASDRLHITQSTVSMHIRELERIVDARLVLRNGRKKAELTATGHEVYAAALAVVRRCEDIERIAKRGETGLIALASSTVPAHSFLPVLMGDFLKREPGVRFEVRAEDSGGVFSRLLSGSVRIGFAGAEPDNERLAGEAVCRDTLVLVTAATPHFRTLKERGVNGLTVLKNVPLIARETESGTQRAAERFLKENGFGDLEPALRTDDPEAIKRAVEKGLGAAILSDLAVRAETADGRLIAFPLGAEPPVRDLYLVWAKDAPFTAAEERFLAYVRRSVNDMKKANIAKTDK